MSDSTAKYTGSVYGLVLVKMGYQHFMVPASVARELSEAAMQGHLRTANQEYVNSKYVYSEGERVDFEIPAKDLESESQRIERKREADAEKLRNRVAELEDALKSARAENTDAD